MPDGSYSDREKVVSGLAATGNTALVPLLEALSEGDLYVNESDSAIVIGIKDGASTRFPIH